MAFLDNSGDIILDAVLTDAGRKRMAEGKFNITKYAFGDDEINYEQFNANHPSGSAFYDLEIMQTPIMEAFTNNTSTMSSRLMTLNDNNFLYLPILKLNEVWGSVDPTNTELSGRSFSGTVKGTGGNGGSHGTQGHSGKFLITCDSSTEDLFKRNTDTGKQWLNSMKHFVPGVILGAESQPGPDSTFICIDQGVSGTDTGLSLLTPFPEELRETAYIIRMDHRLGRLASHPGAWRRIQSNGDNIVGANSSGNTQLFSTGKHTGTRQIRPYAFVDDDNIASYYITSQAVGMYQSNILEQSIQTLNEAELVTGEPDKQTSVWYDRQVFKAGPVGSRLMFTIRAQDTVKLSNDLFGSERRVLDRMIQDTGDFNEAQVVNDGGWGNMSVMFIDSVVSVTGVSTGYTIDIPVRYVKKAP